MRLAMVFIDLFWFVFVALIKVGGLTGAIIYFAEFTDQKASTGLMPLRAYTNMMVGYDIQQRVIEDRDKIFNPAQSARLTNPN
jgi:hypothetical protein